MGTKVIKMLSIFVMFWVIINSVSSAPEMGTNELGFVGTVDGKSYFLEKTSRTWAATKKRCEDAKMNIASITSLAQLNLLKSKFDVTGNPYYWTGARDAQKSSQFVWDHNDATINADIFKDMVPPALQNCVTYKATSATEVTFQPRPCAQSICYTLCEIQHNRNS